MRSVAAPMAKQLPYVKFVLPTGLASSSVLRVIGEVCLIELHAAPFHPGEGSLTRAWHHLLALGLDDSRARIAAIIKAETTADILSNRSISFVRKLCDQGRCRIVLAGFSQVLRSRVAL